MTTVGEDRDRIDRRRIEAKLLERIAAGPSRTMSDADFDVIRSRLEDEIARRLKPRRGDRM
jgi:hypothetical protein